MVLWKGMIWICINHMFKHQSYSDNSVCRSHDWRLWKLNVLFFGSENSLDNHKNQWYLAKCAIKIECALMIEIEWKHHEKYNKRAILCKYRQTKYMKFKSDGKKCRHPIESTFLFHFLGFFQTIFFSFEKRILARKSQKVYFNRVSKVIENFNLSNCH